MNASKDLMDFMQRMIREKLDEGLTPSAFQIGKDKYDTLVRSEDSHMYTRQRPFKLPPGALAVVYGLPVYPAFSGCSVVCKEDVGQ